MLSNLINWGIAVIGGTPFRLSKCTALSYWRRNASDFVGLGRIFGVDDLFKCRPSLLYPIFEI